MKNTLFTILFVAISVFYCYPQQTKILTADKHNEYGLIYRLPTTNLRIDVTFEKTTQKTGPFFQYAKKYIGTSNVVTQNTESWKITDVNVVPFGTADSSTQYLMQLKAGSPVTMCVARDNMLLAINTVAENSDDSAPADVALHVTTQGENVEEFLQYMGEEYLAAQSSAKKALILSENMIEIRDVRNSLTRGTADNMPSDGKQLELMLDNMASQEKAMMAAFAGTTEVASQTISYYFTPTEDGSYTLFRMSDFAGPVDKENYAGRPVDITISIKDIPKLPVDAKGEEKRLPKDAVIYNLPASAEVKITHNGNTLYKNPAMQFSQFGIAFGLDPAIFTDKKDPAFVIFDPVTGSLVEKGSARDANNRQAETRATQSVEGIDNENYSSPFE